MGESARRKKEIENLKMRRTKLFTRFCHLYRFVSPEIETKIIWSAAKRRKLA